MKNSFRLFAALGLCASLSLPVLAGPTAGAPGAGKMGAPGAGRMGGQMGGQMGGGRMGGPGGGGRMRGMGMRGMGRMAQELGLTDAQKAKLQAMMNTQRPAMKAIFDNKTMPQDQKMAKMRAMGMANMKKMNAILTPAQRTKLATLQAQQRARRAQGGGGKM